MGGVVGPPRVGFKAERGEVHSENREVAELEFKKRKKESESPFFEGEGEGFMREGSD